MEGGDADGKSDGLELEEDPVATVISPIKGAKVQKLLGAKNDCASNSHATEN